MIGVDCIEIGYDGYEMHESYMFDHFSVEPTSHNNLLMVVKLNVKNTDVEPVRINLNAIGFTYRLNLSVKSYLKPMLTSLLNDFSTLDTVIEPGGKYDAVLVFEVERDMNPETLNLIITKENRTVIVKLK